VDARVNEAARLLFPAIRWDSADGYRGETQRRQIEVALELGCGGFIVFGGEAGAMRELSSELRERSRFPILIASDLERGAGQQFAGAAGLPPLAAIGACGSADDVRSAARLTAREALSLGVNWILAPVADLDLEPRNPIVGTRAFGSDPGEVAALVAEWVDACQAEGALACAKHFPGHGRTVVDSHAALPVVDADVADLENNDLVPFRAAIDAGVASILTAHVAFPALDSSAVPATLSKRIVTGLLRTDMRFDGLVVTDAMIMEGALSGRGEAAACVAALAAGCDVVLYPSDVAAVADAVAIACARGEIDVALVARSLARLERYASWAGEPGTHTPSGDGEWARSFALRCVRVLRGELAFAPRKIDVLIVDDDLGGPYLSPSREPFCAALRDAGFDVRVVGVADASAGRTCIVALFGDVRSWKGRSGYSDATVAAVARHTRDDSSAIVFQFSHPRLSQQVPHSAGVVINAWGGERVMQLAAADWLAERARA
jgi:beta-glucosidase